MNDANNHLAALAAKIRGGKDLTIAILGLGSVGNYLLGYLNNWALGGISICVGCRNVGKARSDVNIERVSRLIRGQASKKISIVEVDLDDIASIERFFLQVKPDLVVNTSRAYSGLKYGSISWNTIRAYGLWAPLAMKYISNIMAAYEMTGSKALVVNSSYSDAVIPWLKSARRPYPDFGSGNFNHLIPRIKLAVAQQLGIDNPTEIDVTLVASHFHDVVISKEGQTEGIEPLLRLSHGRAPLASVDRESLWRDCAIPMPTDAKRNMMNASSNFEIVSKVVETIASGATCYIHSPGVGGNLGGYPVLLDAARGGVKMTYDERFFDFDAMRELNRRSIYFDGIEDVRDGTLFWTAELVRKVRVAFGVDIPRQVGYDEIPSVASFIVEKIIKPRLSALSA